MGNATLGGRSIEVEVMLKNSFKFEVVFAVFQL